MKLLQYYYLLLSQVLSSGVIFLLLVCFVTLPSFDIWFDSSKLKSRMKIEKCALDIWPVTWGCGEFQVGNHWLIKPCSGSRWWSAKNKFPICLKGIFLDCARKLEYTRDLAETEPTNSVLSTAPPSRPFFSVDWGEKIKSKCRLQFLLVPSE